MYPKEHGLYSEKNVKLKSATHQKTPTQNLKGKDAQHNKRDKTPEQQQITTKTRQTRRSGTGKKNDIGREGKTTQKIGRNNDNTKDKTPNEYGQDKIVCTLPDMRAGI